MQHVLILITPADRSLLDDSILTATHQAMSDASAHIGQCTLLAAGEAAEIAFAHDAPSAVRAAVGAALANRPVDINSLPLRHRRKRLLVADMDSTILQNETLDELAAHAGLGAQVAAITARSMAGELDFAWSLRERVALLRGQPDRLLSETAQWMRLMPGAETLVRTMRAHGAFTCLASGGFRYFTTKVAEMLGFDRDVANRLEVAEGHLTGQVADPIFDRPAKRRLLQELVAERAIALEESLAVGDGANDLDMIAAAGLGVAFRAKPVLEAKADAILRHADLTGLLYLQGYKRCDFVNGNA